MRLLCLHGNQQTSEIFSQRLQRLQRRCKRDRAGVELCYLDAPVFRLALELCSDRRGLATTH